LNLSASDYYPASIVHDLDAMNVAHIANMRLEIPPLEYGGTQRCVAQIAFSQAASCGFHVSVYGPEESSIIEYARKSAQKRNLATEVNDTKNIIRIQNTNGLQGSIRLRTAGIKATGTRQYHSRSAECTIANLLIKDDKQQPYDLIHSHSKAQTAMLLLPYGLGHKTLTHHHTRSLKRYKRYRYPIICISRSQAKLMENKYDADVFDVIHHGIDALAYSMSSGNADYLVWLGSFRDAKGPMEAIQIAKLSNKPIILAGTPNKYYESTVAPHIDITTNRSFLNRMCHMSTHEIRCELQSIKEQCGTSTPSIFVGPATDSHKQSLFGHALGTLFPVKWDEPFGLVMIESMACGTPVIGYTQYGHISCGAVEEVIENGITGFHIDANDPDNAIHMAAYAVSQLPKLDRNHIRNAFDNHWTADLMTKKVKLAYTRYLELPLTTRHDKVYKNNIFSRLSNLFNSRPHE
jgi:glycosyltransferase involved in cell wall biosynthesis